MNKPQCPYCKAELDKFPERKTKCKSCGYFYYAKRSPGEEDKRIVTEREANDIELQWSKHYEDLELERILELYGKSRDDIQEYTGMNNNQIEMKFLEQQIENSTSDNELSNLYGRLSRLFAIEDLDPKKLEAASVFHQVKHFESIGIHEVVVMAQIDRFTCPYCSTLNRKVFATSTLISDQIIPGNCTCKRHGGTYPSTSCQIVANL